MLYLNCIVLLLLWYSVHKRRCLQLAAMMCITRLRVILAVKETIVCLCALPSAMPVPVPGVDMGMLDGHPTSA